MQKKPSVAVVLLNWNGRDFLSRFLPQVIAAAEGRAEVILADNASTDGSVQLVLHQFPKVRILNSFINRGFAGGYNFFLQQVQADYYVLLNTDVEVTPGWLDPLIEWMEANPSVAACQPKIRSWHQRNCFEYAGAAGGWLDALGYPFARGRVFDAVEEDRGQYDDPAPVFWASGAAFFVRANVFHALGGFDEYFFAHQEEIDLCWRMQRSGHLVYVCPSSVVYHVGGGTLPTGSERKVFLNFRNSLVMLAKNLPWYALLWKLPLRLLLDGIAAWKELLQGRPAGFKAVAKAHLSFVRWIGLRQTTPRAGYPPLKGWYRGSVVWQYFVRGKHRFSEIVR